MIEYRWPHGVRGRFDPRPATTDDDVLREVWDEQVYVTRRDELEGLTVLDLGANIGAFTVLALASGADRVVAIEPDPGNFARLCDHVEANLPTSIATTGEVILLPVAAGGVTERGFVVGEEAHAHTEFDRSDGAIPVEIIDVAELVEAHGPFDMVKIDIEGAEWDVLPRLLEIGMAGVSSMIVEHHGPAMLDHLAGRPAMIHRQIFGEILAGLAELGHVEVLGRPSTGGMLRWLAY